MQTFSCRTTYVSAAAWKKNLRVSGAYSRCRLALLWLRLGLQMYLLTWNNSLFFLGQIFRPKVSDKRKIVRHQHMWRVSRIENHDAVTIIMQGSACFETVFRAYHNTYVSQLETCSLLHIHYLQQSTLRESQISTRSYWHDSVSILRSWKKK